MKIFVGCCYPSKDLEYFDVYSHCGNEEKHFLIANQTRSGCISNLKDIAISNYLLSDKSLNLFESEFKYKNTVCELFDCNGKQCWYFFQIKEVECSSN